MQCLDLHWKGYPSRHWPRIRVASPNTRSLHRAQTSLASEQVVLLPFRAALKRARLKQAHKARRRRKESSRFSVERQIRGADIERIQQHSSPNTTSQTSGTASASCDSMDRTRWPPIDSTNYEVPKRVKQIEGATDGASGSVIRHSRPIRHHNCPTTSHVANGPITRNSRDTNSSTGGKAQNRQSTRTSHNDSFETVETNSFQKRVSKVVRRRPRTFSRIHLHRHRRGRSSRSFSQHSQKTSTTRNEAPTRKKSWPTSSIMEAFGDIPTSGGQMVSRKKHDPPLNFVKPSSRDSLTLSASAVNHEIVVSPQNKQKWPRRDVEDERALRHFRRGLERQIVISNALRNASLATTESDPSQVSVHTVAELIPYLAEFEAAGLSVTSIQQRTPRAVAAMSPPKSPSAGKRTKGSAKLEPSERLQVTFGPEITVPRTRFDESIGNDESSITTVVMFSSNEQTQKPENTPSSPTTRTTLPWLRKPTSPAMKSTDAIFNGIMGHIASEDRPIEKLGPLSDDIHNSAEEGWSTVQSDIFIRSRSGVQFYNSEESMVPHTGHSSESNKALLFTKMIGTPGGSSISQSLDTGLSTQVTTEKIGSSGGVGDDAPQYYNRADLCGNHHETPTLCSKVDKLHAFRTHKSRLEIVRDEVKQAGFTLQDQIGKAPSRPAPPIPKALDPSLVANISAHFSLPRDHKNTVLRGKRHIDMSSTVKQDGPDKFLPLLPEEGRRSNVNNDDQHPNVPFPHKAQVLSRKWIQAQSRVSDIATAAISTQPALQPKCDPYPIICSQWSTGNEGQLFHPCPPEAAVGPRQQKLTIHAAERCLSLRGSMADLLPSSAVLEPEINRHLPISLRSPESVTARIIRIYERESRHKALNNNPSLQALTSVCKIDCKSKSCLVGDKNATGQNAKSRSTSTKAADPELGTASTCCRISTPSYDNSRSATTQSTWTDSNVTKTTGTSSITSTIRPNPRDKAVFKGLQIAMAAACSEDINTLIEEIAGPSVRRFLADLSAFDDVGVDGLASMARRLARRKEREKRRDRRGKGG